MFKYLHDKAARTVYRFPSEPDVTDEKKKGKHVGWRVAMECRITRADNWLEPNGRWKYATSSYPVHNLDGHYSREQAVSYFRMHHEPRGEEITKDEYERIHAEYEAEAKSRRPGTAA